MSDLERPYLKSDYDHMPRETYAGLGHATHRFADFIPVADGADQFVLRQSIEAIGLVEPIVLFEGKILDGRHRYKACMTVGVEPRTIEFMGDEEAALQFVLAKNIARRNLTTAQKLSLRDKLTPEIERLRDAAKANQSQGLQGLVNPVNVAEQVGALVGLSRETIRQADKVKELAEASPEAVDFLNEMLAGNIGVEKAYKQAKAFDPDEIDRMAKKQSAMTDTNKLKATLASAIGKAHALLVNADPSVLTSSYEVREQLMDLECWVQEALTFVL